MGIVTRLTHLGGHDTANSRSSGGGRSTNRSEKHIGHHIDYRQASRQASDQHLGEIYQSQGDASTVHDVSRQDKERDRQQRKTIQSRGHPQGIGGQGWERINMHQHRQYTCHTYTIRNGHTHGQQKEKADHQDHNSDDIHKALLLL